MIYKPHPYQVYATRRIVEDSHVGLLLGMGLGKSVITLTAIDELIYDRLAVDRVLIIAPKKLPRPHGRPRRPSGITCDG